MGTDNQREMETLRGDIEVTRQRISGELEAIGEKLTPEHARQVAKEKIVEAKDRAIENVKSSARSAAHIAGRTGGELGHAIRENPIPTAMVCVGAGWLIWNAVQRARAAQQLELPFESSYSQGVYYGGDVVEEPGRLQGARERMSSVASSAKDRMSTAKERVSNVAGNARYRVGEAAHVVRDRATDLAHRGKEGAHVAWTKSNDAYTRNPLLFGAVAIAAGFGIGMMIPSTERENQLLGERRERVLSRAKNVAREAQHIAMDSAKEGIKAAKSTAKEEVRDVRRNLP